MVQALPDRFWAKVQKEPDGGCWLWDAFCNPQGYGRFGVAGRTEMAHRVSYEFLVGPIPEGLDLDHLCRVRNCVNPDHLEPVTHAENILRGDGGLHNKIKTHCLNGHPYSGENLYVPPSGVGRLCRTCRRENKRESRRRRARIRLELADSCLGQTIDTIKVGQVL